MPIKVIKKQKERFLGYGFNQSEQDIEDRAKRLAKRALHIRKIYGNSDIGKDMLKLNRTQGLLRESVR